MTERKVIKWDLHSSDLKQLTIERHCHNCGRKVKFHDSMIRRHNANGKNIYQFAIYKCEKGHTWNKKLNIYKSFSEHVAVTEWIEPAIESPTLEMISIQQLFCEQIEVTDIYLRGINGRTRIDKLLGQQIADMSRAQITRAIENSWITLDDCSVKGNTNLKSGQTIQLNLVQLNQYITESNSSNSR